MYFVYGYILFDPQATTVQPRYMVALAGRWFRKAAERLFIAQPTLSASIAQWEQHGLFGVRTWCRGTKLTPVGEQVIMAARKVLDALEAMECLAAEAAPPFYGPVRLGVIPTIGPYALPYVHRAIADDFPDLRMPVAEATTADSLTALDRGQIDIAMVALLPGMEERYARPIYGPFTPPYPRRIASRVLMNSQPNNSRTMDCYYSMKVIVCASKPWNYALCSNNPSALSIVQPV